MQAAVSRGAAQRPAAVEFVSFGSTGKKSLRPFTVFNGARPVSGSRAGTKVGVFLHSNFCCSIHSLSAYHFTNPCAVQKTVQVCAPVLRVRFFFHTVFFLRFAGCAWSEESATFSRANPG
eukprot:2603917-Pleurochrysis_carterae.AAC.2